MIERRRTVLVTDAGRGSAIAFVRSLGAKGWRVIAADCDERSAGFHSRYAEERFVYPAPRRSPRAFVEALHGLVQSRPIDLVVPVTDECIHPLDHARARFAGLTVLAIAPPEALAATTDKRRTVELARRLGVPVPETRVVAGVAEARAAAAELTFPLVVKPCVSRRYLPDEDRFELGAVSFARDLSEVEARVAASGQPVLLQEYERGTGVGVECLAREGEVLQAFQHRRLAEIPVTGGASAWRESTELDPELLGHARALIRALRWTGLVMVEFKRGRRPWLVEINGRVWGSLPLACLAGVDFPGALAELYCPSSASPDASGTNGAHALATPGYRVGLRAYNLELMLSWIAQVMLGRARHPWLPRPGRARAFSALAGLLDPAQKSDLSGGRDPTPRLYEAVRIARNFAGKAGKLGGEAS